jgi:diaminopimelate epimerase
MKFEFTKMNALGNDYILIDGYKYKELLQNASRLAVKMCDRHFGIGSDGIIFASPSQNGDTMMRMFNADGSEAEMCGNGIRQMARFVYEKGLLHALKMDIETLAGLKHVEMALNGDGNIERIRVDMGEPVLQPALIPVAAVVNTSNFARKNIEVLDRVFEFTFVSMGNPHAVTFVKDVESLDVAKYGRPVEYNMEIFPKRTNVEFIEILSNSEIKMRVWERGSGETLACGTGACASVVACFLNGLTQKKVKVHLLGGILDVEWADNGRIYMTGSSQAVFDGIAESEDFL